MVSSGQRHVICASPQKGHTHISGLFGLDSSSFPFSSLPGFIFSYFYSTLCPLPISPISFPVLRTLVPQPGDLPLSEVEKSFHPTCPTWNINNSYQCPQLVPSCFSTRWFTHIVSNPDNSPTGKVLVFLRLRGSESLICFPEFPQERLQLKSF